MENVRSRAAPGRERDRRAGGDRGGGLHRARPAQPARGRRRLRQYHPHLGRERPLSGQLDPFTTEIIRNGLIKAAEDMRAAVEWTAYSPVIYEGVDLACGIVDPTPSLIAETAGIPAFL